MTAPIKTINKFAMQEILRSDRKIDYDCFYKVQIAEMVEVLREGYKEMYQELTKYKERNEKAIEKINKLDFDNFVYGKRSLKDVKRDLLEILEDKENINE